jgi:prepilin-type N-terminal cleavage/methylation domain-containing protein
MQYKSDGFTLVELVVTILILGILAAMALPRLNNMRSEATLASVKGVYAAATSAAQLNFAAIKLGKAGAVPITDGASLLATMDSETQSSWFAPGGPYMWEPGSEYGIEVVTAESSSEPAKLAIVDNTPTRIYP